MANIWIVNAGSRPRNGDPFRTMPLNECRKRLELRHEHFRSDLGAPLNFGDRSRLPAVSGDPSVAVVEVDADEAAVAGWTPGYYVIDLSSKEAETRCAPVNPLGYEGLP
jgi:hypothetical protein